LTGGEGLSLPRFDPRAYHRLWERFMPDQDKAITPLLSQYQAIKREHQDVILLFRLGDFYEMFGEDAKIGSQVLELTLTSREIGKGRRVPMCGLPYHALERYLPRLLAAGHKAAVCDQMEDAKKARGIVKREVTRILTPGTVVEDYLLEEKANNFLVSLTREGEHFGLAALDCSTGDFRLTEIAPLPRLLEEVSRLQPAEILLASELLADETFRAALGQAHSCAVTPTEEALFLTATAEQILLRHFQVSALSGFGCDGLPAAQRAAAGALLYLQQTQKSALQQIRALRTYATNEFMVLDAATRRNLELFNNLRDNTKSNTLLALLDGTITAMGGRLLRGWLGAPLLDLAEIHRRQQAVGALVKSPADREKIRQVLKSIADIERLVARSAAAAAHGRDLSGLRDSLTAAPELFAQLANNPQLAALAEGVDPVADLRDLLATALNDAPPITLREGNIIRPGYNEDLDKLRRAKTEGKEWIASLETKERERSGIKSLKIGFNSVFGYYLEISRPNLPSAPADYIRKQTLANAERFITPELKEYESLVLGAEEKIAALEFDLFCELRAKVAAEASRLQALAGRIAAIDVLAALAEVAVRYHYVCPQVAVGEALEIHEGRHPVVEVTQGEPFIPNDCRLDGSDQQVVIITGPNMAGKSTYLRQTALIVLMAQIGSFVPAKSAAIGLVDRIFTRVGAADDLASGRSTFMLEMTEAANILHNATGKSLIILDEIGRGTSTFDGLSIAWAVAEYIHNSLAGAKTLFATHYHQLNELAETLPRIKNYRVAVKEKGDSVIFLRKVVPGGTDRSYGIHVARLAGLPQPVLERAKEVLWSLEQSNHIGQPKKVAPPAPALAPPLFQMALFEPKENPLLAELAALDLDDMTPREALSKLAEIQARLKPKQQKETGK
jgi:DNA mismatch repair protein MutS